MSDLTERLIRLADGEACLYKSDADLIREAAAEIKRLREALGELKRSG